MGNFSTVTNPYKFELDGVTLLGTSGMGVCFVGFVTCLLLSLLGQNILDLKRLTSGLSTLDLMRQVLQRGHLFPTAPDTLDAYPFENEDPLVLNELPHIFFVGNQQGLESTWMDGTDEDSRTLLISLPSFASSKKVALLNLRNMRVKEMDFSA